MTRIQEPTRHRVRMETKDVSDSVREALQIVEEIANGVPLKKIADALDDILQVTGRDAEITLAQYDDGYIDIDLSWYRMETDEEMEKRLIANEKRQKTAAKNRKLKKSKKVEDEKNQLARLLKKYPQT